MGGRYGNAVQVRALVGKVLVGDLAAFFAHGDHSVPARDQMQKERATVRTGDGSESLIDR